MPKLSEPFKDQARLEWHEVKKVGHYSLKEDAATKPMQVPEGSASRGPEKEPR